MRIYWGASDGGTNAGSWSNVVNMGVLPVGPFSTNTYNLTPNTLYYYRCIASNAFGTAWASNTTNFTTLFSDSDSDGIADSWEISIFGSTTNANASSDYDNDGLRDALEFQLNGNASLSDTDADGLSDWQEWVAGTSLTNAGLYFRVEDCQRENEGGTNAASFVFYWETVTGRLYSVYSMTNLMDFWATNVYRVPGTGNRRAFTNEDTEAPGRFFRIGVEFAP